MKNHLLFIFFAVLLMPVYAYNYDATPTGTANPPEVMNQDPNVLNTPTTYGPAKPISKQPPPGSIVLPAGSTNNNNTYTTPMYTTPQ